MTASLARATDFEGGPKPGCDGQPADAGTDYHVPFGVAVTALTALEQGQYAVDFFTSIKTAYIAAGTPS